jgi:plastocyanin domain-containing protein
MPIIINSLGAILVLFILWWFFGFKPRTKTVTTHIDITVDNGIYSPASLRAKLGKPLKLTFLRRSKSPCAATVIFHGLNISENLPLDEKKTILFTPDKLGTYEFTCQMSMYRGTLIIEE